MKVFEFHFNSEKKSDLIFDTFCYQPENIYEKKMGGIFMLGELKGALPHNFRLLEKISACIKKEFYSKIQRTPQAALKDSLKKINELLAAEVSRDNTDWLGNLNFSILSLKDYTLHFTKVGGAKIFLIRGNHIANIGEKLDNIEIEPYPLKIFSNIVSGKLNENDILFLSGEKIYPHVKSLMNDLAKNVFEEKRFKDQVLQEQANLTAASGAFILINAVKTATSSRKPKIIFQKEAEKLSLKKAVSTAKIQSKKIAGIARKSRELFSVLKNIKKPKFTLPFRLPNLRDGKNGNEEIITESQTNEILIPEIPQGPIKVKVKIEETVVTDTAMSAGLTKNLLARFKIPALKFPKINFPKIDIKLFRKKFLPIIFFAAILIIGFLISRGERKQAFSEYQGTLSAAQDQFNQAESFMILTESSDAKEKALNLLATALSGVSPLTQLNSEIKERAVLLKEKIENDLKTLSNLEVIENPEEFFSFNSSEFIPQRIIENNGYLYFFSPYAPGIFKVDAAGQGQLEQTGKNYAGAAGVSQDNLLFFSKPNELTPLVPGQIKDSFTLKNPYPQFEFDDIAAFSENLYFFDSKTGEITRYKPPIFENKDNPLKWLRESAQTPAGGKSMTVDGSVWIIDGQNNILEYHFGNLQKAITPAIFPKPKSFSKITSSPDSPYLFILEPSQKRIILLDKTGNVYRQFQSEKFGDLLDISVSGDGKILWILNGLTAYKINL